MQKTWFITGASRGFGRIWTEAALKRGDRVTATARKLADVADLAERFGNTVLPLALDVTDSAQVEQAVHQAYTHFGRLDVLVNNAGASLFAATEEASDEQIRGLFDANYLGMVPSAPSGSAIVAETRERSHSRCLQRTGDNGIAPHLLLLRHEMGSGSAPRIPRAGGEGVRVESDTC